MNKRIARLIQIVILLCPLSLAYANPNLNVLLRGNYAFNGVYNCLETYVGGFNAIGQPNNPAFSLISYITVNGRMNFDGTGTSKQTGNFVEITSTASAANTSLTPGVGSGTFTVGSSAYTVALNRGVTVDVGAININILTGDFMGFGLVVTPDSPDSSQLSGQLSINGSLLLTTAVPWVQTVKVFDSNGNNVATFPRRCSVTMTLTPSGF